jgi:hypothetical protein
MITSKRDIDTFRNIAKLYCSLFKIKGELHVTIDSFNYQHETIEAYFHPIGGRLYFSLDYMLSTLQEYGIYKDYSIDRTTHIYKNDRERAFRKTSIAEEI